MNSNITIHLNSTDTITVDFRGIPLTTLPLRYENITQFDVTTAIQLCEALHVSHNSYDIHSIGYWTDDGKYHKPADFSVKELWAGRYDDEYDFAYEYSC